MNDKATREAVAECRRRLDAYVGDRIRKADLAEWLDAIERAMDSPPLEYGVDYGAWGT